MWRSHWSRAVLVAVRAGGPAHLASRTGDEVMKLCVASPSLERVGSGRNGLTLFRLK